MHVFVILHFICYQFLLRLLYHRSAKFRVLKLVLYLGQSIREWTKWNLLQAAFKKFEVTYLLKQTMSLQIF